MHSSIYMETFNIFHMSPAWLPPCYNTNVPKHILLHFSTANPNAHHKQERLFKAKKKKRLQKKREEAFEPNVLLL